MPAVNAVIELVNIPVVPVSMVLLPAVVGVEVVAQHTPRAVIVVPPSLVTFPPLVAVVEVIEDAVVVVRVASTNTCPYLLKAGLLPIFPFLSTKFALEEVLCPYLVTP